VLGERTEITFEDIHELKYCSSVFKETLRLWPPAPNVIRVTSEPMVIEGYHIPANTSVLVNENILC
jgi:cytochrome P450